MSSVGNSDASPAKSSSPSRRAGDSQLTEATILQLTRGQYEWTVDPVTARLTQQTCALASDYLHRLANEPTVGMHHITTHVLHKGIPRLRETTASMLRTAKEADAASDDVTDMTRTVRGMHELVALKNTKDAIARSIALVEAMLSGGDRPRVAAATAAGAAASPAAAPVEDARSPAKEEITFKSF